MKKAGNFILPNIEDIELIKESNIILTLTPNNNKQTKRQQKIVNLYIDLSRV